MWGFRPQHPIGFDTFGIRRFRMPISYIYILTVCVSERNGKSAFQYIAIQSTYSQIGHFTCGFNASCTPYNIAVSLHAPRPAPRPSTRSDRIGSDYRAVPHHVSSRRPSILLLICLPISPTACRAARASATCGLGMRSFRAVSPYHGSCMRRYPVYCYTASSIKFRAGEPKVLTLG